MQVNSIAEANKYWNDSILNKRFGGINNGGLSSKMSTNNFLVFLLLILFKPFKIQNQCKVIDD